MTKLTTSDLTNLQNETSAVTTINNNFASVETAMENTLSRDGTTPNTMEADLDMNSNNILNLPSPSTSTSPVRVVDMEDYVSQINGTGGSVLPSIGAGDTLRLIKAVSTGVSGIANVKVDASHNITPDTDGNSALGTSSVRWSDLFLTTGGSVNWANGTGVINHSGGKIQVNLPITPATTDAATLGTSAKMWSDLYLATGGEIRWNDTDAKLVHAAGLIKSTVDLTPDTSGGSDLGTSALPWGDLFVKSGSVVNFNNGDATITHSADNLTVAGATVVTAAGTATIPPLKLQSGTNLTTAAAGAIEYDGRVFYSSPVASGRGVSPSNFWKVLAANNTLASSTSAQAIFDDTGTGAITVASDTTYEFEMLLYVNTMSATSGNATFSIGGSTGPNPGTAVLESVMYQWHGLDNTTPTTVAAGQYGISITDASAVLATAGTGTSMIVSMKGIFRVTTGGTIIPSIALVTATAAVVAKNSYIKISPLGTSTVASIGNWS